MIKQFDNSEIIQRYQQGESSYEIVENMALDISARQVQRIVKGAGLSRHKRRGGRLDSDGTFITMHRSLFDQLLVKQRGLNPFKCGRCGLMQKRKCDIHHTKYEGATLYDLAYLCRRCNTQPENRGLA